MLVSSHNPINTNHNICIYRTIQNIRATTLTPHHQSEGTIDLSTRLTMYIFDVLELWLVNATCQCTSGLSPIRVFD